jgi:hypothetical protein
MVRILELERITQTFRSKLSTVNKSSPRSRHQVRKKLGLRSKALPGCEKSLDQALERHKRGAGAKPAVVYGDVCLGFNNEMRGWLERHGAVKVEALNCIDCLLGGGGKLLEIDPDHLYLFLTPAFIEFTERIMSKTREETRRIFSRLKGILLIDSLGNLNDYQDRIRAISDLTGLPILETRKVGLVGLKKVLSNALEKVQP